MGKRNKKQKRKAGSSTAAAAIAAVPLVRGGVLYFTGQNAAALKRVPVDHVGMLNDTYFADPEIAVAVGTKTYFGCCGMCKGRLASDAAVRVATDPVSGHLVDKADAVIGALASGRVLYFESERTLAEYQTAAAK